MWGLPPPESLFNANMALPLTKKDEEKVEDLSRRGIGGYTKPSKQKALNTLTTTL
jgi:hypothetical protein